MNILFVGNSHTYFNAMPFQVRELINHTHRRQHCQVAMLAVGGVTLGWHAHEPQVQCAIRYQNWHYIVLQQKTHPFDGYENLLADCRSFYELAQGSSARLLFFSTWSEKRLPENQRILDDAFSRLCREISATLVPISKAWHAIMDSHPHLELYYADGEHASSLGSYLAACVFYATITGRSPVGLPSKIVVRGDTLCDIEGEAAGILQAAAAGTIPSTRRGRIRTGKPASSRPQSGQGRASVESAPRRGI